MAQIETDSAEGRNMLLLHSRQFFYKDCQLELPCWSAGEVQEGREMFELNDTDRIFEGLRGSLIMLSSDSTLSPCPYNFASLTVHSLVSTTKS